MFFFAEAWKATTWDTPTAFLLTTGARKAERQDCLSRRDWRAIEAILKRPNTEGKLPDSKTRQTRVDDEVAG